jgi:hypothetical protein
MANEYVIKNGLIVGDLTYPATDGSSGDVFTTDGSGNITLQAPGGGTSGGGSVERVRIQWDPNNEIASNSDVTDETAGVSTNVTNLTNSDFEFTFTGHARPFVDFTIWAEDRANGLWTFYTSYQVGVTTGRPAFSGDDTDFGSFDGTVTITLNSTALPTLSNTGGLTPQGPRTYLFFYFDD